ncbi:MAG: hypothetical protein HQK49_16385 [Oligoflexia bacterium]|nr:hypothetical protein [Oligoflexia bacterium]
MNTNLSNENLKWIKNKKLLNRTLELRMNEKKFTLMLLNHLAEIEHRRLYAELGFSSFI